MSSPSRHAWRSRAAATLLTLAGLLFAPSAFAGETKVALTISPLHLIIPMVEVTGEVRLLDKVSIAGILGGGRIQGASGSTNVDLTIYEIGAQARYYVTGSFDSGAQVGVELLQLGVTGGATDGEITASASGEGFSAGAFAGYKHTFGFGLVLDGQLGYSTTLVKASASGEGASASASQSGRGVLLNLNIGWAF